MKFLLPLFIIVFISPNIAAETFSNEFKIGMSHITFEQTEDTLTGPMTPEGITSKTNDVDAFIFTYDRFISENWSVHFSMGLPPRVTLDGAGTGAELGEVGSADAHIPAVLALYHWRLNSQIKLYAGAGVNYAKFDKIEITDNYTHAFYGVSSKAELDANFGSAIKFGAQYDLSAKWFIDLAVSFYDIKSSAQITTDTLGVGEVTRNIKTEVSPTISSLTLGYRF